MTVSTTTNKIIYAGLIGQDTFAYNFRVDEKTDMNVYLDGVLIDQGDWSITGLGDDSGGDVTLLAPLVADVSVTLLREVDETQLVDYLPFDAFPAETHEGALDKLTFLSQQLQEQLQRTPTLPVDSPLTDFQIGTPVANELVKYNATEDGIDATGKTLDEFNAEVAAAAASADASAASAVDSANFAIASSDFADNSSGFADKANQWANEAEDVPVEPGEFSAFHWAQKALLANQFDQYLAGFELGNLHTDYAADLDDILINSKYFIDSTAVTNEPADFVGLGVIETDMTDAGTDQAVQLLTTMDAANEGAAFIRHREGGAWSEWASFGSGGGLSWEFPVADFTAEVGVAYMFIAGAAITQVTLPAGPEEADAITLADLGDTWDGTINIDGNGETIEGLANLDLETAGAELNIVFTGTEWEIIGLINGVYRGETPPAAPQAVVRWWDTNNGLSYIYYNDGDSSQWVQEQAGSHAGDPGPLEIFINGVAQEPTGEDNATFQIPSGIKQFVLSFDKITMDASSKLGAQLGTGGVLHNAGYSGFVGRMTNGGVGAGAAVSSVAQLSFSEGTGNLYQGNWLFTLVDPINHIWSWSGSVSASNPPTQIEMGAGSVTLTGPLDIVALVPHTAAVDFDGGTVNLMYDNPGQLPNIVPPGTVVGFARVDKNDTQNINSTATGAGNVPQSGDGTVFLTEVYTPKFANSLIIAELVVTNSISSGTAFSVIFAIFRDDEAPALGSSYMGSTGADATRSQVGSAKTVAGQTTPITFTVEGSTSGATTLRINASGGTHVLAGNCDTHLSITEIAQ